MRRFGLASLLLIGCSVSAFASPITYTVNRTIGGGSVVGTIETDGTLGTLLTGSFLDWTLTLTSPNLVGGSPDVITAASGGNLVLGTALFATGTEITFDFTQAGAGAVFEGSDGNAWCFAAIGISCAGEPSPAESIFFGTTDSWAETTPGDGIEVMATAGVPEPLSLSLVGAGLVGAAALRRRKKAA